MKDIIKEQFTPTVTITTEEYNRLREIERQYNEFLDSHESMYIQTGSASASSSWFYGYHSVTRIINPDGAVQLAAEEGQRAVSRLNELRQKKVPVFNWPGTKVNDL